MISIPYQAIDDYLRNNAAPACAYFYDLDALARRAQEIAGKLPAQCRLYYAIKANSEQPVLAALAPCVYGFEVASGGEIEKVRTLDIASPIAFGGPGKTACELRTALAHNVELYHIESRLQLERLAQLAQQEGKRVKILLRVNPRLQIPSATLQMGGTATQFGIDEQEIPALIEVAEKLPSIDLQGFHFHALSNNLDSENHLRLVEQYLQRVLQWQGRFGLNIQTLNVGGGIGINYQALERQFDWPGFCQGLESLLTRYEIGFGIAFECGRFIAAACGFYLVEVTDIKRIQGKNFAILRGGNHHFRLPSSWQHNHPFRIISRESWPWQAHRPALHNAEVTLCGELCTPKDVLARDVPVKRLRAGDCVIFTLAGAYGWHISHHDFLSHPHPDKFFVSENAFGTIEA